MLGPAELVPPVDGHHVRADAVDLRAHLDQQPGEVLDMRLAGRVRDRGRALGQRRGHQRVLGRHHRGLVHEDPAWPKAVARRLDLDPALAVDQGAHVAEGVEMRVEAPPADEVAARRRHPRLAEARQQRAGEQERGADPCRQLLVHLDVRDGVGLQADLVLCRSSGP